MAVKVVPGYLSKQLSQKQEKMGILSRTAVLSLKELNKLPLIIQWSLMKHWNILEIHVEVYGCQNQF